MREISIQTTHTNIYILSTKNFLPGAPHCCFILDRFRNREKYLLKMLGCSWNTTRAQSALASAAVQKAIIIIPIVQTGWKETYFWGAFAWLQRYFGQKWVSHGRGHRRLVLQRGGQLPEHGPRGWIPHDYLSERHQGGFHPKCERGGADRCDGRPVQW